MSRLVARQMEMLGNDISAHMAQLELPVNTHPDEAMRVSFSLMQEAPGHTQPAIQLHIQQQHQQQQLAATPAAEQQQEQQAADEHGGLALVMQAPGNGAQANAPPRDDGGGPHGLAALIRERPELVEKVLAMSAEQFVDEWRELASNFREVLAAHEQRPSEEGLGRILDLFRVWGGSLTLTLHFRPENAEALFATSGDAPPGMWEAACARLQPTQAQRSMLAQLWRGYAAQAKAIRGERAAAVQAVQDAAQQAATITPATLPASTLGGLMSRYLDMFNAAGRLSSLRDAEFVAMLQLMGRTGAVRCPRCPRCPPPCPPPCWKGRRPASPVGWPTPAWLARWRWHGGGRGWLSGCHPQLACARAAGMLCAFCFAAGRPITGRRARACCVAARGLRN